MGVVVTSSIVGKYQLFKPWNDKYEFAAEFDVAPAIQLAARQEVRIAGVPVGRITKAEPTTDGHARVSFSLDEGHEVYQNARLVLRSKSPLNIIYVALDPGDHSAGKLKENGVIPIDQTERIVQPYELLDELDARARAALTDLVTQADIALASAPRDLPEGVAGADAAAEAFTPVVKALQTRRANVRRLVTSLSQIATAVGQDDKRLRQLVDSLSDALTVVTERDAELSASLARLPRVTKNLRTAMADAKSLTDELTPVLQKLHSSSEDLPAAISGLADTVDSASSLVAEARPVVRKAGPVVNDLRPLAGNLNSSLRDLTPVTANLPQATERLVPWLDDLGGFVYNTSSSFSLGDVNGGLGRAHVVVKVDEPTGGGLR
ncbi:MlaD family protein [Nocardioides sp. NPDC051685]|uniref:MlaD family protein n=1 Tax=Nocardioides sp. NPDC051685 TaxID=3364334 RepID=UPI00379241D6